MCLQLMKLHNMPQFSHHVWLHCSGSQGAVSKFSNVNDLQLSLNIVLYWEKVISTSHDIKDACLKSAMLLSSAWASSPSDSLCPTKTSFILYVVNPSTCSSTSLTLRRLMSYIYGATILDVSRSHTTTQHSR